MDVIYLAGGCFWGTQHYISRFNGVLDTEVGYANGVADNPTYQQVYTDQTGHVECVKVIYDKDVISLKTLCRLFFKSIDPVLKNRQGEDCGTRYRTGIYWECESDIPVIFDVFREIQSRYKIPLAVETQPIKCFYTAEEYHQKYLIKNSDGYCHLSPSLLKSAEMYSKVISELRECLDDEMKVVLPKCLEAEKGECGEDDKFLGVSVPDTHKVAKVNKDIPYDVLEWMLESEWHEVRLCARMIMTGNERI